MQWWNHRNPIYLYNDLDKTFTDVQFFRSFWYKITYPKHIFHHHKKNMCNNLLSIFFALSCIFTICILFWWHRPPTLFQFRHFIEDIQVYPSLYQQRLHNSNLKYACALGIDRICGVRIRFVPVMFDRVMPLQLRKTWKKIKIN